MAKKLCELTITGNKKIWAFEVEVDEKYIEEYRADGLEIDPIINTIPFWWVNAGLPVRLWCFFQDLSYLKNPFKHWEKEKPTGNGN